MSWFGSTSFFGYLIAGGLLMLLVGMDKFSGRLLSRMEREEQILHKILGKLGDIESGINALRPK
jgi:hypothetical protein